MSNPYRKLLIGLFSAVAGLGLILAIYGRGWWVPIYYKLHGTRTVAEALQQFAPGANARLAPYFTRAGVNYPPKELTFLAIKAERRLEIWARDVGKFAFITSYPILALSGEAGPKTQEGDRQVPEGLYEVIGLNPNSAYHLSMKINYPNAFDLQQAEIEGRSQPGSDIFIHGGAASVGCLAIGDEAIEDLFVLVANTANRKVPVVIAPTDPRSSALRIDSNSMPRWTHDIYEIITREFSKFIRESPNEARN